LNTKLNAVTDAKGRPLKFFTTAGEVSDYTGAAALLGSLPAAEWMIADRGYDADWFRDALKDKGIRPASLAGSHAAKPSATTSDVIGAATGSRSCSAG
jgi:transposase